MTDIVAQTQAMNLHLSSGKERLHILRDITFTISRGEVVSIVGPSGSGKTSLLMVMGGLERASAGTVEIGGASLIGMNEDQLAAIRRRHVGILFQNFHLIASMTALENVALALDIAFDDLPLREIRARARAALAEVGLAAREDHLPSALSGGRGPLSPAPSCCWPMSRPAISIRRRRHRRLTCCLAWPGPMAWPCC